MKFFNPVTPVPAEQMQFVKSLMARDHVHVSLNTMVILIVGVDQNV